MFQQVEMEHIAQLQVQLELQFPLLQQLALQGSSATNANLPPYYALAYIMRTA